MRTYGSKIKINSEFFLSFTDMSGEMTDEQVRKEISDQLTKSILKAYSSKIEINEKS